MNKKLNKKGFTLVELLAVIVILVAIMGIAIPTISSSLERTKERQNQSRYKIIETAAEEFVTDNKNNVYKQLNENGANSCYIGISELNEYLSSDEMQDADGNLMKGFISFSRPNSDGSLEYKYHEVGDNKPSIPCIQP